MKRELGLKGKRFIIALMRAIVDDHVLTGSAALSYYLLFSLFPGLIFLLTLLPYLPIANLHQTVMGFLHQALPTDAADAVESVVAEVTLHKRGGLLSFGILLTLWSASSAISAIMEEINVTYDLLDSRPYWKGKLISFGLSIYLTATFILSGVFLVGGAWLQNWLTHQGAAHLDLSAGGSSGWSYGIEAIFAVFKWAVVCLLLLSGFSVTYFFGLDQSQLQHRSRFRLLSPGSAVGVLLLVLASNVFRLYVAHISDYTASYGSLGAVIVLLLWLYIAGLVLLLGSEVNALLERKDESWRTEPRHEKRALRQTPVPTVSPRILTYAAPKDKGDQPHPSF